MRLLVLMAATAWALPVQADSVIGVEMRAERLVTGGPGGPRLMPAAQQRPGDEIYYSVRFTNASNDPVEHASVTVTIPPGMRYVAGSASGPGADVYFSIDGGAEFAPADALRLPAAGGDDVTAGAERYTHIRWVMRHPLDPGATGYARFRAVVAPRRPATSARDPHRTGSRPAGREPAQRPGRY